MAGAYDINDLVRCTAQFKTTSGTLVDPTAVIFKLKNPAGTVTSFTYGVDADLVRDSLGKYHIDVAVDRVGIWHYRFEGTGTAKAASESKFSIKQSAF